MRLKQTSMFKQLPKDYGGTLRNKRKGRVGPRPISTKHTMHLVLKSTKATGERSFLRSHNKTNIRRIIDKFAFVYGVKVVSFANVWNHLHLQIKLSNRFAYAPFIRAITGAIAISVGGRVHSKRTAEVVQSPRTMSGASTPETQQGMIAARASKKFWDHRPFTRVVESYKAYLNLKDYIRMNTIEASGWRRREARTMVQIEKRYRASD